MAVTGVLTFKRAQASVVSRHEGFDNFTHSESDVLLHGGGLKP